MNEPRRWRGTLRPGGLFGLSAALFVACAGAPPSTPKAEPRSATPVTDPLLDGAATLAESAGASRLEVLARGVHVPGDSLGSFLVVRKGECSLLLARGNESILDLDLYAFEDNGAEWGRDEATDADPALLLCPGEKSGEREVRLYVAARVAQGSGLVSLGVQRLPLDRQTQVLDALGRKDPEKLPLSSWAGIDSAIAEHHEILGGSFRTQRRAAVPVDSRIPTSLSTTVPSDACLDVLVLVGGEAKHLELEILDDQGRIVTRGRARGAARYAVLCSQAAPSDITLKLRPHSGRGTAAVILSETRDPSVKRQLDPELEMVELLPVPKAAGGETVSRLPKTATPTGPISLGVGRLSFVELVVVGCSRVDLVPEAPLIGHRASLYDRRGNLVAEASGRGHSTLFVCARKAEGSGAIQAEPPSLTAALRSHQTRPSAPREKLRLSVEATLRSGPLHAYVTSGEAAPAQLGAAPLAASRLLGLAFDSGLLESAEQIGKTTQSEARLDRLTRLSLSVPASHCLTVMAALGQGGRGLQITAIDSESGLVIDHHTANFAGKVRACGDAGGTRSFVVELRATDAPGPALIATRQTSLSPPSSESAPRTLDSP